MTCALRTFRCHVCQEDTTSRTTLYSHLKKHQTVDNDKRRDSGFYQFISTRTIQKQPNLIYSLVSVCCLCNNLHDTIVNLTSHFKTHLVSPSQSIGSSSPSSSTTTTAAATNKRSYSGNINTGCKIKSIKPQKTITFDTTLVSRIVPLSTPKISRVDREKLSNIYIFRMQSNDSMAQEELPVVQKHQDNQRKLVSLIGNHVCSLDILKQELFYCRTHLDLDEYKFLALDHANTSLQQQNFYRMLKHVLVDFTSNCFHGIPIFSNHERTLFADRIIPIFLAFENYHQNIHFE